MSAAFAVEGFPFRPVHALTIWATSRGLHNRRGPVVPAAFAVEGFHDSSLYCGRMIETLSHPISAGSLRCDDVVRPHHFVVFVFEQMAVPHEPAWVARKIS